MGNGDAGAGQGRAPQGMPMGLAALPRQHSQELIQASPHGFPELLRLVAIHRQGVFRRVEPRRTAAARGFAGLARGRGGNEDERGSIPLLAIALDPLGEVIRILRYVMRSEESRPFLGTPTDADVNPEGVVTGHQRWSLGYNPEACGEWVAGRPKLIGRWVADIKWPVDGRYLVAGTNIHS